MTLQEFEHNLHEVHGVVSKRFLSDILFKAGDNVYRNMKNRIFSKGLDINNMPIAPYSTKPAYFTKKQFAKPSAFSPEGKKGNVLEKKISKHSFKKGRFDVKYRSNTKKFTFIIGTRERTSMYLKGGYEELRRRQGKRTDITNLTYRGDLKKDFSVENNINESAVFIGFKSSEQSEKRKDIESIKGRIFGLSEEDKKNIKNDITYSVTRVIRNVLVNGVTAEFNIQ